MKNQNKTTDRIWIFFIGILIILIAILHYSTSTQLHHFHQLYRVLFYLPIILAAFRYQLKGGLITAALVIIIYVPHVVFQWGGDFLFNFSRFLEMIMYLIIGSITGYLTKRERGQRENYHQAALKLEKSLQQLKQQSEKIAEIEDQLRSVERVSILGELATTLAHEVRNPLGSIWGVVEILQDECKEQDKDSEFFTVLIKEVKRLNQVVENYSNFARKPKLSYQSCNLQQAVQTVIYLLEYKARKQNVQLSLEFPEQSLFVTADEGQIQQILINLILNSLSAITTTGTVTIKGEQTAIDNKKAISLSVIDNGQGMTEKIVDKIFKPFFTTKTDGTGLGLSIVKRIVDQNKWKMKINSTPGKGTVVTVLFISFGEK